MKSMIKVMTILALLATMAGCVVTSVYPFYTTKDLVFEPALVAEWAKKGSANESPEHWSFEKIEGQSYKLTVRDADKQTEFDAHLFKLKDRLFLDTYPRERADHSIPAHYLFRVVRIEPDMELAMLDYDWLKQTIASDPKAIRHTIVPNKQGEEGEGSIVLTADTAELQAFLLKHEKTEGAFGESLVLTLKSRRDDR